MPHEDGNATGDPAPQVVADKFIVPLIRVSFGPVSVSVFVTEINLRTI